MSLSTIIKSGIKIADTQTKSVQSTITLKAWIGDDGYGAQAYASAVALRAVVEQKNRPYMTAAGETVTITAQVTIVGPVAPTSPKVGETRQNPVDPRDIIVLPDGSTRPIVLINALINPDTNAPYMVQISLGS
jgi:hypothetical protein